MDEAYYFEALGVPAPDPKEKDAQAKGQDDADPANKGGSEGTAEQEVADPENDEDKDGGQGSGEDGEAGKAGDSKKQSRRTDKKFAEVRRQFERERDAAIAKAKEEAKAELDRMVAAMNLKNPYTGKTIQTKAEYDEALARRNSEKAEKALQKIGLSKDVLQEIVKELPEVKEAREAAAEFKTAKEQTVLEKARLAAEAEVREISKLDPAIQSIEDFKKMPDYEEFRKLVVENKLAYLQAFRLLRYDKLTQGREAGAARQAAFNAASKNHLLRSDSAGDGEVTVTSEDIERFRAIFPDMSTKEIAEYVRKYAKNTKKTE